MDLISRDKAQDAVFSKEDIMGYMDGLEDGDINRTIRSAIRLIERVPSAFEGMTNGEAIQALFPNADYESCENFMRITSANMVGSTLIWGEWWNAPYKAESEVKPNETDN